MKLALGQIVQAKRDTGVCKAGERGVVYETYFIGGRPGASVIFEAGNYDGFSPEEQEIMLKPVMTDRGPPLFDEGSRSYAFVNVGQLSRDYQRGQFNFHPEEL